MPRMSLDVAGMNIENRQALGRYCVTRRWQLPGEGVAVMGLCYYPRCVGVSEPSAARRGQLSAHYVGQRHERHGCSSKSWTMSCLSSRISTSRSPSYTETLGLKLQHRADEYAQIGAGTPRLSLSLSLSLYIYRDAMQKTLGVVLDAPSLSAPSFELGFKVSDCDAAFSKLVAGRCACRHPTDHTILGSAHCLRERPPTAT